MQETPFALFDFDGTISKGDSIIPFLFFAVKKGYAPWYQLIKSALAGLGPILFPGRISHSRAKSWSLSFLRGRTLSEMDALARDFYREKLSKGLFPEGVAELTRLHDAGVKVLLVSASPEVYMRVLPEFLPVEAVLATPCGLEGDASYTGLVGENCKGVVKPLRIAAWLAANHYSLDYDASFAFGDSQSDAPMLHLVRSPVLVCPKKGLRREFPEAKVVDWKRAHHPSY